MIKGSSTRPLCSHELNITCRSRVHLIMHKSMSVFMIPNALTLPQLLRDIFRCVNTSYINYLHNNFRNRVLYIVKNLLSSVCIHTLE